MRRLLIAAALPFSPCRRWRFTARLTSPRSTRRSRPSSSPTTSAPRSSLRDEGQVLHDAGDHDASVKKLAAIRN